MNTIYANRSRKSDITEGAIIYWFTNSRDKLIGIVSYGTLTLEDTVLLISANTHRFISYLDRVNPTNTSKAKYYICD